MEETFDVVLKNKSVGLVRADSGFYSDKFLSWFEKRDLNYVIAVKFYENFKYEIGSIEDWSSITKGLDVAELYFKPNNTNNTRRYILVRKKLKTIQIVEVNYYLMNLHIDIVLMLLILLFLLIKYIIFIIQEQMQKIESKN